MRGGAPPPDAERGVRYAYLHGFASSSGSRKGRWLADRFAAVGLTLELPDLNAPSFRRLTYTAALEKLATLGPGPWRFIGSSLGGYLAARFCELYPQRVDRLLLLCPGFSMVQRWPQLMGEEAFGLWERNGAFFFPDALGEPTPVHWGLIEDVRTHPETPEVGCPTRILHGTRDEVVPIHFSRQYVAARPGLTSLVEVEDGHDLMNSLERIAEEVLGFLAAPSPRTLARSDGAMPGDRGCAVLVEQLCCGPIDDGRAVCPF